MTRAPAAALDRPVPPDQADLAARLRLSATRLARMLRRQADLGPSPSQLTALATIAGEGPLTLGALADIEHVAPPTITKVVEKLEAQGLIERRADVDDRRRSLATATSAGLALLAEGRARKDAILATRIAQLDPDQLDRLADALDVLEVLAGSDPA
ncbi:MAG: MarR family transcriptional regulator [Ilumatobacteraceae bacterium]